MKWVSALHKWFVAQSTVIKALVIVLCISAVTIVGVACYVGLRPDSGQKDDDMLVATVGDPVIPQQDEETQPDQKEEETKDKSESDVETEKETEQIPDQTDEELEDTEEEIFVNTTGRLINGNFSAGIKGFEVYAYYPNDITYTADAKNGFCIDIAHTGDEDWHIQLKQSGIRLQNGSWYKLTLDAKSSMARNIICTMQRDGSEDENWTAYSPSQNLALTKNWQTFTIYFQMTEKTDKNAIFNLSMGTVGGVVIMKNHTVSVRNISLQKLDDSWIDSLRKGDNLIANNDFSYKDILWDTTIVAPGAATATFDDNKAVFDITNPGALDWNVQLKQSGILLEQGNGYKLTFKASSTVARTIKIGFMDKDFVHWYGGADVVLGNGNEQTVTVEFYMDKATNTDAVMMISMGKIENADTPASVITLSDLKLVKASGITMASAGGYSGGGSFSNPFTYLTDGWSVYDHEDKHAGSCVVDGTNGFKIDISDTGTEEWHVQLQKKNIALENGKWYKITFETKSTINRDMKYIIQRDGAADEVWTTYSTGDSGKVSLNSEWQTITQTFQMTSDTDTAAIFNFSLGSIDGTRITQAHSVWVRNIKLEETTEPQRGPVLVGEEMLQNGSFTDAGSKWEENVATYNGAAATISYEDNKAIFNISSVGQNDYDIQLRQSGLLLEKGCKYRVTFEVESTADRIIKVGVLGPAPDYRWYGGKDVSLVGTVPIIATHTLTAEEQGFVTLLSDTAELVTLEFTMDQETDPNATLQISMGQIWRQDENGNNIEKIDTPSAIITLSNFSMMKIAEAGEAPDEPDTAPPTTVLTDGWVVNDNEGVHTVKSSVDGENGYKIDIKDTGTEEWHIQLQKTGVKLENGKKYAVTVEIKSTLPRSIIYMLQENGGSYTPYSDTEEGKIKLTENWQTFTQTFTMTGATDENAVFNFSLGTTEDARITDQHTIWIRNIKLEEVEETEPGQDPDVDGENLLGGKESWEETIAIPEWGEGYVAKASVTYGEEQISIAIDNPGTDEWHVQLKQGGLLIEKGCTYRLTMDVSSTESRQIKLAVKAGKKNEEDNYYGSTEDITAESKNIVWEFTMDVDTVTDAEFQINMGKIGDSTPASTILLSNIKLVKLSGEEGSDQPADTPEEPGEDTTDWSSWYVCEPQQEGEVGESGVDSNIGYKIVINNSGSVNYSIQLQRTGISLEEGKKYRITFDVWSTIERGMVCAIQNRQDSSFYNVNSDNWDAIKLQMPAKQWTSFEQEFTMEKTSDIDAAFNLSLGTMDGTDPITQSHTIWIRNIKLEPISEEGPGSGTGSDNMLKNGDFALGGTDWGSNIYGDNVVASSSFEGGKATFTISSVGQSESEGIQLQQSGLTLEAGQSYKVTFQIKSSKSRVVKLAFVDPENGWDWYGGEDFNLDENTDTLIEKTITVGADKATSSTIAFQISMGMFDGVTDPGEHIIEISNVSVIKQ